MPPLLGMHWVFDGVGDPALLAQAELLRQALTELPDLLQMTRVSAPQTFEHRSGEQRSVAGIILIAESHFSLHAFPEQGVLHGDLFSCKPFAAAVARDYLCALYGLAHLDEQWLERSAPHARLDAAGARR